MDRYQFIVRILEPTVLGAVALATATSWLKRKTAFAILGGVTTGLALWVVLNSWDAPGGLEDLGPLIVFGYVVLPLAAVLAIGAIRLPKPESWWWHHVSSEQGRARAIERYPGVESTGALTGNLRPDQPGATSRKVPRAGTDA